MRKIECMITTDLLYYMGVYISSCMNIVGHTHTWQEEENEAEHLDGKGG